MRRPAVVVGRALRRQRRWVSHPAVQWDGGQIGHRTLSAAGVSFKTPATQPSHDEVMEPSQDAKLRTRIAVVTVYVTDQDKAKAFYSEALGFKVKDDQPYGPGFRWLTVVSPMDLSTELYLAHQDRYPGARTYREAMYEASTPTLGLAVGDIQVVHQRLTAAGVRFTRSITKEVYGGVGASIDDGCGNILNLHQDE